jgi:hypothetical protein
MERVIMASMTPIPARTRVIRKERLSNEYGIVDRRRTITAEGGRKRPSWLRIATQAPHIVARQRTNWIAPSVVFVAIDLIVGSGEFAKRILDAEKRDMRRPARRTGHGVGNVACV